LKLPYFILKKESKAMQFINTISGKKVVKLGLQISTYIINEELSTTDT